MVFTANAISELLHALEEGIMKYLLEILVAIVLKPQDSVTFDEYARSMCCQLGERITFQGHLGRMDTPS